MLVYFYQINNLHKFCIRMVLRLTQFALNYQIKIDFREILVNVESSWVFTLALKRRNNNWLLHVKFIHLIQKL